MPTADASLLEALLKPPVWEKRVVEIAAEWDGLPAEFLWAAGRLRVFLLTWDPFEWQTNRPAAFATSTSRSDGVGLALYLPHWQAMAQAGRNFAALPAVIGRLGESVLAVASEYQGAIDDGSYPAGVQSGTMPRLLSRVSEEPRFALPSLSLVGDGWQPIQFDVLEDLAQDDFGPADLDRSPVRFSEAGEGRDTCPGCAGEAVDFPDGLKDAQAGICGRHRGEALRITTARLEAAKASNPAGWEALLEAGQRLIEPHLPDGLGPRLVAAALVEAPSTAMLIDQADLVVGAAALMSGLPDPETPLGTRLEPVRAWLGRLPADLAELGLAEEAAHASAAASELLTAPSSEELKAAAAAAAAGSEEVAPAKPQPFRREVRIGRNAPCPCGSGKKYKFCHGAGARH